MTVNSFRVVKASRYSKIDRDVYKRQVMEATENYHTPVAKVLHDARLYVSVVHAKLIHGYGNNDLRRVKTDRKDAVKPANYGLNRWLRCV